MNRRIEKHRICQGRWSKGYPLGKLCLVLALALTAIWSHVNAQDSNNPSPPGQMDPTPVAPLKVGKIPSDPYEVFVALGLFGYPLALTSVVVVWFTVERMVVLRYGRVIPRHFVKRFFEHLKEGNLDPKVAMKLCEDNGSPIALVLANGVKKWGKSSVEVEQAIIDGGERQVSQLRKHIRILNGAATVAPLLGLLGTVAGMIQSFNQISQSSAMGKSEALAGGIGLSLLTTAAGLAIAIPSLIMYMYFTGRVDSLVIEMDGMAQELVDYISAEGLAEQARSGAKTATAKPETKRPAS
ncbi:MotA/TolQ/ExbB proton channel family protein [Schlesneria paludicola]|uniref:MotA/TolQ/ExbB proton channel family protein n=1 Tax=Schlesneria paludicola TaxID=360056 RepID=UPI00029AD02D|nr:MotA/TolQ/ExbB proton channel family protein [Schlesneria paludicola]